MPNYLILFYQASQEVVKIKTKSFSCQSVYIISFVSQQMDRVEKDRGWSNYLSQEIGGVQPIYCQNISIIKIIRENLLPIQLIEEQVTIKEFHDQYGGYIGNLIRQKCLKIQKLESTGKDSFFKKGKDKERKIQITNFAKAYVYKWVKQIILKDQLYSSLLQGKKVKWKGIQTDKSMLKFFFNLKKLLDDTSWKAFQNEINEIMSDEIYTSSSVTFLQCCSKIQKCLGLIDSFHWTSAICAIYSKPGHAKNVINRHFHNQSIDKRNLERIYDENIQ